jgi:hypothetical protein
VTGELFLGDSLEFLKPVLGEAPKTFDAVDVISAVYELVIAVVYPEGFLVTEVNQSVVSAPTISV